MNLFHETTTFAGWFFQIMRTLLRTRPFTTLTVIFAEAAANMTRIASMLLPLKIILLAGSTGVPRYFPFIDPAHKSYWIIGLTAGAICFYLFTLLLETMISRMSENAGREILYKANQLFVVKNQEETIKGYYASFCGLCASLLFVALVLAVLAIINLPLLVFLIFTALFMFVFSALALRGTNINPGHLKRYITENVSNYLKILTSIAFLAAFIVLLVPFITTTDGNILVAILSILLLRRTFNYVVSTTRDSVKLTRKKHEVNALIFPYVQIMNPETKDNLAARNLLHKSARTGIVRLEMEKIFFRLVFLETLWMDTTVSGLFMFHINWKNDEEAAVSHSQLQVFPLRSTGAFENEDFLFTKVPRRELKAPDLITRFDHDPFACQILDYGSGEPVSTKKWKDLHDELLMHYCSFQPPASLIQAYTSSHLLLWRSLNKELVSRVEVALDTPEEVTCFEEFKDNLPRIRDFLKTIPLYIHNQDITTKNVVQAENDDVYVMTWGRWSLQPVGTVLPLNPNKIGELAVRIEEFRSDAFQVLSSDDLDFVFNCHKLEKEINRGAFKSALKTIEQLLEKRR